VFVDRHQPPYKTAGAVLLAIVALVSAFIYQEFRGALDEKTQLTLLSPRAGLVVEPGSKVTYNGVEIGRVSRIGITDERGAPMAKLMLDVNPGYIQYIPANVAAEIRATTVFGNKYISFSSPKNPSPQRISSHDVIDAASVTTEFNTLFETVTSIAERVDPIKLNQTLAATAEALTGLGGRFGQSLENGNQILDNLNPQMSQIARGNRGLADLAEVYADASPSGALAGAGNPYVYPDNLPRVNAHGGPAGRPGCWQDVNRYLWPAPYLVMDTGASIAPYNHVELGQPLFIDYVWGRQVGEYTINP
jgi:phospholipid/cholesterol/gamma-HCH transport system substrate-binding protein